MYKNIKLYYQRYIFQANRTNPLLNYSNQQAQLIYLLFFGYLLSFLPYPKVVDLLMAMKF